MFFTNSGSLTAYLFRWYLRVAFSRKGVGDTPKTNWVNLFYLCFFSKWILNPQKSQSVSVSCINSIIWKAFSMSPTRANLKQWNLIVMSISNGGKGGPVIKLGRSKMDRSSLKKHQRLCQVSWSACLIVRLRSEANSVPFQGSLHRHSL